MQGIATAVDKSGAAAEVTGTLGIKGLMWNNIGNVGAMAIIAAAFLYLGQDVIKQSKEDRAMFREELKSQRASQEARWEKTDLTHSHAMEKMGMIVERATAALEQAVKVMEKSNNRPPANELSVKLSRADDVEERRAGGTTLNRKLHHPVTVPDDLVDAVFLGKRRHGEDGRVLALDA